MTQYKAAGLGSNQAFMQAFGNTVLETDTTTITASLASGDTVDLLRIAGGTHLVRLSVFHGDLDTGTALVFKLGYRRVNGGGTFTEDDDYFGSSLSTWQAAVLGSAPTQYAFTPIYIPEDVFITATVTTSASGLSGTPSITAIAFGQAKGIK